MNRELMEAEAQALEQGAKIIAKPFIGSPGPDLTQLAQALEILLKNEAARTRHKLRGGKSLAHFFPDVGVTA